MAVLVLGGALLRLVLGPLADHLGAKKTALIGLALTLVPLLLGWLWSDRYLEVLLVGLLLVLVDKFLTTFSADIRYVVTTSLLPTLYSARQTIRRLVLLRRVIRAWKKRLPS